MKTLSTSNEFSFSAISVSHILFDHSDYVNIIAKCRLEGSIRQIHLLMSFANFNDILRFTGDMGEQIHVLMVDQFLSGKEAPYVINIQQHFGKDFVITSCRLSCSLITKSLENSDEKYFMVSDFMPLNLIQQAKNLKQNALDFGVTNLIETKVLSVATQQLADMYKYYCGLLELDIHEDAAREKANLNDSVLFNMAKCAYLQKH